MVTVNKGYCFNCSEPVGEKDYEEVGNARIYVCNEQECQKALQEEMRAMHEDMAQRAAEDDYQRYG